MKQVTLDTKQVQHVLDVANHIGESAVKQALKFQLKEEEWTVMMIMLSELISRNVTFYLMNAKAERQDVDTLFAQVRTVINSCEYKRYEVSANENEIV